jgi:hypothetical protein
MRRMGLGGLPRMVIGYDMVTVGMVGLRRGRLMTARRIMLCRKLMMLGRFTMMLCRLTMMLRRWMLLCHLDHSSSDVLYCTAGTPQRLVWPPHSSIQQDSIPAYPSLPKVTVANIYFL